MNRLLQAAAALLAATLLARADVVTLKDGRVLEGEVLEDDGTSLKIKLRKGTMTLSRDEVVSVEKKPTPEQQYRERAAKLDAKSAPAQLDLGRWAASKELVEEAVRHLKAAWEIDPKLTEAIIEMEKLDWHLVEGKWLDADAYYPTIGWVKFEGKWISPEEHAYRLALRDVLAKTSARDDAKAAVAAAAAGSKKLDARIAAEKAAIEKAEKAIAKAQTDEAAAQEKFKAAEAKVKAASDKLVAIQTKERPKEGEPPKPPSAAEQDAEKKLSAAQAAASKESKALSAAKQAVADQNAAKRAAEQRAAELEKERDAGVQALAKLEEDVERAQREIEDANARAAELKAEWEKSK
jgi:hypothetical protein